MENGPTNEHEMDNCNCAVNCGWQNGKVIGMTSGMRAGMLAVIAAGCAATVVAHHSPAAYDLSPAAVVTLEGTVTRVQWANPHVYVYLESILLI